MATPLGPGWLACRGPHRSTGKINQCICMHQVAPASFCFPLGRVLMGQWRAQRTSPPPRCTGTRVCRSAGAAPPTFVRSSDAPKVSKDPFLLILGQSEDYPVEVESAVPSQFYRLYLDKS